MTQHYYYWVLMYQCNILEICGGGTLIVTHFTVQSLVLPSLADVLHRKWLSRDLYSMTNSWDVHSVSKSDIHTSFIYTCFVWRHVTILWCRRSNERPNESTIRLLCFFITMTSMGFLFVFEVNYTDRLNWLPLRLLEVYDCLVVLFVC